MSLFQSTMLLLAVSCALLLVGFSARDYRWGPWLMMLGIVGAMALIGWSIYQMLPR
ncbi:hypothetical protein [Comamonas faecalis]